MTAPLIEWARRHPALFRVGLLGFLVLTYAFVVRPVRAVVGGSVVAPALAAAANGEYQSVASRGGLVVFAMRPGQTKTKGAPRWAPPLGVLFILPALFLAAAFPLKPYWVYLLLYHLVAGGVGLGLFVLGLLGYGLAFDVLTFTQTYLLETVSLAVPVLLWVAAREGGQAAPVSA